MTGRHVLVLQGPNLDLLGTREPEIYGSLTLGEIGARMDREAEAVGVTLRHVQSNHEGVLVEAIHEAGRDGTLGAVVNAAAYTHTSVALRDALVAVDLPFVEVHLSNVFARESFRHSSMLADRAIGVVSGFGADSYILGLRGLLARLAG